MATIRPHPGMTIRSDDQSNGYRSMNAMAVVQQTP